MAGRLADRSPGESIDRWQAPVDGAVRGAPVGQEQLERDPEQEGQARSVLNLGLLGTLLSLSLCFAETYFLTAGR